MNFIVCCVSREREQENADRLPDDVFYDGIEDEDGFSSGSGFSEEYVPSESPSTYQADSNPTDSCPLSRFQSARSFLDSDTLQLRKSLIPGSRRVSKLSQTCRQNQDPSGSRRFSKLSQNQDPSGSRRVSKLTNQEGSCPDSRRTSSSGFASAQGSAPGSRGTSVSQNQDSVGTFRKLSELAGRRASRRASGIYESCNCQVCMQVRALEGERAALVDKERRERVSALPLTFQPTPSMNMYLDRADRIALAREVHSEFPDGSANWITEITVKRYLNTSGGDLGKIRKKLRKAATVYHDILAGWVKTVSESPLLPEMQTNPIAIGRFRRPMLLHPFSFQRWGDGGIGMLWVHSIEKALGEHQSLQCDIVCDMYGFQSYLNLDFRSMLTFAGALETYFGERPHRLITLDMPRAANAIYQAAAKLLAAKTKLKIFHAKLEDPDSMQKAFGDLWKDNAMRQHFMSCVEFYRKALHVRNADRKQIAKDYKAMVDAYFEADARHAREMDAACKCQEVVFDV